MICETLKDARAAIDNHFLQLCQLDSYIDGAVIETYHPEKVLREWES